MGIVLCNLDFHIWRGFNSLYIVYFMLKLPRKVWRGAFDNFICGSFYFCSLWKWYHFTAISWSNNTLILCYQRTSWQNNSIDTIYLLSCGKSTNTWTWLRRNRNECLILISVALRIALLPSIIVFYLYASLQLMGRRGPVYSEVAHQSHGTPVFTIIVITPPLAKSSKTASHAAALGMVTSFFFSIFFLLWILSFHLYVIFNAFLFTSTQGHYIYKNRTQAQALRGVAFFTSNNF